MTTTSVQPDEPADSADVPMPFSPETADVAGFGPPGQLRAGQAARPQLLRELNEQLLLQHIRQLGRCSRAELARMSGLSKPTVSLALANVERSGLVREAGQRTGVPGRSAVLYEIRPDAGYVLGLDIGHQYMRGAVADLTGDVIARSAVRTKASSTSARLGELIRLADQLCTEAGIDRSAVTQTVIGSPGVYDPGHNAIALAGGLAGWGRPAVLAELRNAFGQQRPERGRPGLRGLAQFGAGMSWHDGHERIDEAILASQRRALGPHCPHGYELRIVALESRQKAGSKERRLASA